MKTYGLSHEQPAMVSVVQREGAAKNARTTFKTPITVGDVRNSRMIAYPFRLLQCCLVTDGGGALIDPGRGRARPRLPAKLAPGSEQGAGLPARHRRVCRDADDQLRPSFPRKRESRTPRAPSIPLVPRFRGGDERNTSSRAFRVAGPKAFAEAGITHDDVDHLMIYDAPCSLPGASFAHLPIYGLEVAPPLSCRNVLIQNRFLAPHLPRHE
jgi:acetyl-CoA acetyltransferase